MVEHIATILGGLAIIADVAFGKDSDTPNGPGDYWASVEHIYWLKKNGTKGKEIPQAVRDKAEKYDPYFATLTENVSEMLAYEDWERKRLEKGEDAMSPFDVVSKGFS